MTSMPAARAGQEDLDATWSAATSAVAEGYAVAPGHVDATATALVAALVAGGDTADAEDAHLVAVLMLLVALAVAVRAVAEDAMDEAATRSARWVVAQLDALGVPAPGGVAWDAAAKSSPPGQRRYTPDQLADLLAHDVEALRVSLRDAVAAVDTGRPYTARDSVTGWTDQVFADAATHAVTVAGQAVTGTWEATSTTVAAQSGDVIGWVWTPSPHGCCGVCGMLAGTFHTVAEPMHSHPHCRCVQRWVTRRGSDAQSIPPQWRHPDRATVRAAFGPAAELAWRDGRVSLDDDPRTGLLTRRPWHSANGETGQVWARRALRDVVGVDDTAYYIGQVRADAKVH